MALRRQQLREVTAFEDAYQYLIDWDSIFAKDLHEAITGFGPGVLKSPVPCPNANGICERSIGTLRCECLDRQIPLSESHLRVILKEWITHYNEWSPAHGFESASRSARGKIWRSTP